MKVVVTALITLFMLLSYRSALAQKDCDAIKKENESLRQALKITNPIKMITSSNIDFNLIACTGNSQEQTVTLTFTLLNHDPNQDFQFQKAFAIDQEGNEYKSYTIKIGSEDTRNTIYTDIPVKTTVRFSKVLPGSRILKTIPISFFYGEPGHTKEIEFRNIDITWQ